MTGAELDDAAVWAWWCALSAEQGLPPKITDPVVLAKLVTLALAGTDDDEPAARRPRPRSRSRLHRARGAG